MEGCTGGCTETLCEYGVQCPQVSGSVQSVKLIYTKELRLGLTCKDGSGPLPDFFREMQFGEVAIKVTDYLIPGTNHHRARRHQLCYETPHWNSHNHKRSFLLSAPLHCEMLSPQIADCYVCRLISFLVCT